MNGEMEALKFLLIKLKFLSRVFGGLFGRWFIEYGSRNSLLYNRDLLNFLLKGN